MGSKAAPGRFDCYEAALADEPMFVLLARDVEAPNLIERWAAKAEHAIAVGLRQPADRAKIEEARQCAADMRAWRRANNGAWHKTISPATK